MKLTLGEQLKTLRRRAGKSQENVGGASGLSANTLGKIEADEIAPRTDQLELIVAAIGATMEIRISAVLK